MTNSSVSLQPPFHFEYCFLSLPVTINSEFCSKPGEGKLNIKIEICDLHFSLKFQSCYVLEIAAGKNVQSNYDDVE